jgi:soluble lytic murein transglycosylase-like protein
MDYRPMAAVLLTRVAGRLAARIADMFADATPRATPTQTPSTGQGTASSSAPAGTAFAEIIASAARRHELPEELLRAVINAESGFNPQAVSKAGAKGLMQLMDGTARSLGVSDSFDPAQNIEGGATYLQRMLKRYGTLPLALAAYNAGPGAVDKYAGIPPYEETQRYVKRIMSLCGSNWEA